MITKPDSQLIPNTPGSYQFKDAFGRVIYVGKAKVLRSRINSYFQPIDKLHTRTQQMIQEAESVEWIQVQNEVEALILEHSLIQEHQPRFNVRLRDDKSYPFLAVTTADEWPRAMLTRGKLKKGNRYFGPYVEVKAIRDTLDLLQRTFPLRTCTENKYRRHEKLQKPCLEFHIKKCCGPCVDKVTPEEYQQLVRDLLRFLEGHTDDVVEDLLSHMKIASKEQDYERAARYRDRLFNVQKAAEKQVMVGTRSEDFDVVTYVDDEFEAAAHAFFVRNGRVLGQRSFILDKAENLPTGVLQSRILEKLYIETNPLGNPKAIFVETEPHNKEFYEAWLSGERGSKVQIRIPQKGTKKTLMETVRLNAEDAFKRHRLKRLGDHNSRSKALNDLQKFLNLPNSPLRIECYDMSHLQGSNYVGSMVVMEDAILKKKDYRKFKIKSIDGNDDYAAMAEVVRRRLMNLLKEESDQSNDASSFSYPPQLLLVDGGKGQLSATVAVLKELNLFERIPVASLAKRNEEIFLPGKSEPVILPRNSESLYLLQRIRDESHRFAITYHRQLRKKGMKDSVLNGVSGLGPSRRARLIKEFGSINKIRQATLEDLLKLTWLPEEVAKSVYQKCSNPNRAT
ncbi:MAG: excinuclease ABC subunit C [Acidimicrobiaceae bacterium]|nr:excinuclease ABC subunit C [Acidimicrobiaceae bacterium]|tara:strand:- start:161 stop:2029 length:1869 start_codon:yes stop_codon:yes gene_type:complete